MSIKDRIAAKKSEYHTAVRKDKPFHELRKILEEIRALEKLAEPGTTSRMPAEQRLKPVEERS